MDVNLIGKNSIPKHVGKGKYRLAIYVLLYDVSLFLWFIVIFINI